MPAEEHLHYIPESPAVDLRGVIWPAIGAVALLAFAIGGLYAIYDYTLPVKTVPPPQEFPQPRVATVETDSAQLRRLADEQNTRLKTWRWTNDQHTLVQIPIDRAMQLLAQKGDRAWSPLLPSEPALSSPTAGAERAVTPESVPTDSTKTPPGASSQNASPAQEKRQ
jgi:hypothetical protein